VNAQPLDGSTREQVLVDLSLWLARVLQYSPSHPACAQLGARMHATVTRALAVSSPLAYGVLRDEILIDGAPGRHPVLRSRVAPQLHARGVLFLRFVSGVTLEELTHLVELLTLPVQTIFDRGGLQKLAAERNLVRVQIEEIAHEISAEERDAQVRRAKFRALFKELLRTTLARRRADAIVADRIAELLEHPDIVLTLLEEDALGIAEAAASLALITQQQEARTGEPLTAKLGPIFLALATASRVRLLLGFPSLAGDFRRALARVLDAMTEPELARLVFPSVRAHAADLEAVLYALTAIVPHDGTRLSALRRVGLGLFDLAHDDASTAEVLAALARPAPEHDSFGRERDCLREHAAAAASRREVAHLTGRSVPPEGAPQFDGARSVAEVIEIATRTRTFDRFCARLVRVAPVIGRDGALGALRGLSQAAVAHPTDEGRKVATQGQHAIAVLFAPEALADLDRTLAEADESASGRIVATVALFAEHAPEALLDRLDVTENRKFRRILLDALAASSTSLLPLVRPRLHSSKWYVVRNAVLLLDRAHGCGVDLLPIAMHAQEQVRREILRAVRSMRDVAAMDIVAMYLTDPCAEIAANAPPLLRGELLGPTAIARLTTIAHEESNAEELRRRVVHALGRSAREEAATALFQLLQPKGFVDLGSGAIRDLAASALRHSPAPNAQRLFDEGLHSSAWRVRKACERAVEQK
jgi:hypothetical protein